MMSINIQEFDQLLDAGEIEKAREMLTTSFGGKTTRKEKASIDLYRFQVLLELQTRLNERYLVELDQRITALKELDIFEETIKKDIDTRAVRAQIDGL